MLLQLCLNRVCSVLTLFTPLEVVRNLCWFQMRQRYYFLPNHGVPVTESTWSKGVMKSYESEKYNFFVLSAQIIVIIIVPDEMLRNNKSNIYDIDCDYYLPKTQLR